MPLGLVSHPQPLAVATWPVYLENPSLLTEAEETWGEGGTGAGRQIGATVEENSRGEVRTKISASKSSIRSKSEGS